MKMSYKDLAVKPTEAQLAALLHTDKGFQTDDYNAYWDIRTGEVRIDHYDIETHGIPLFKDGLAGLSDLNADEVVLQFKKASYRRIQKLCDEAEFKSYHKGISMARQFVRGFFLLDELDLHTRTWLLSSVIQGAPVEESMALLDLYTEQQLKASMVLEPQLVAPLKQGDVIGKVEVKLGDEVVRSTDLVALEMMPQPPKERAASNPWPEWPRVLKVDYGQTECMAKFGKDPRVYQTTVKEFLKDDAGNLTAAVISYLKPERDPETGRTNMVPTGEEFTYNCELAFIAAGFVGCESYVADAFGVSLTGRGCVDTDHFRTNVDKVFACGDMRRGQSLVVWGLREGRDCAAEVDRYLMGYTNL